MEKSEVFKNELSYIQDERIRNSAKNILKLLPNYFYEVAASSTGKYHPSYTLGNMGLTRHVKAAVRIAYELFNIYKFSFIDKDLIIFALLIHDGLKHGKEESEYTKFSHPLLISEFLIENKDKTELTDEEIDKISHMVKSHMGKWNTSEYEKDVVLPIPSTPHEKFVHMCDYLASRKVIHFEFNDNGEILE